MAQFEIKDGVAIIPEGTTEIENFVFADCTSLEIVYIPESVKKIGKNAFAGCYSIKSIVVAEGNPIYDSRDGCNAIILTKTNNLLYGCKSTIIPESVTEIEENAFRGCTSLEIVYIPESVKKIGINAFAGCYSIKSIVVAEGNPIYDSRDGCNAIILTKTNNLLYGCKSTIIPKSVTEIEENAFRGCTSLEIVYIPESVTEIGINAFAGCYSIKSIVVAEGNPIYDSRDGCNAIILTKTNNLLYGCKSTIIPESVTEIDLSAFAYCSSLKNIIIPKSVKDIGCFTFYHCTSLKSVTISESVTEIGEMVFDGCTSLKNIIIPESVMVIGNHAFLGCSSLENVTIPVSVEVICDCAFADCTSLKSIIIPESVKTICKTAFDSCTSLESVTFLSRIEFSNTLFGNTGIFFNCTSLKTINVPSDCVDYYKKSLPEELHDKIVELDGK